MNNPSITEDTTLVEALSAFGLVVKPGPRRSRKRLYTKDGRFTGTVTATQGWALVEALEYGLSLPVIPLRLVRSENHGDL